MSYSPKLIKEEISVSSNGSPSKKTRKSIQNNIERSKPKFYKQKFRASWLREEFNPWLIRNPSNPDGIYCSYCDKKIEGGIFHVRRHAKSSQHSKNTEKWARLQEMQNDEHSGEANDQHDNSSNMVMVESLTLQQQQSQSHVIPHLVSNTVGQMAEIPQHFIVPTSQHLVSHHIEVPHIHIDTQQMSSQAIESNSIETSHMVPPHISSSQVERSMDTVSVNSKHLTDITAQHHELQHSNLEHNMPGTSQEIVTTVANTTDGNLFQPTLTRQLKKENTTDYMVEFDEVGSSSEVTVPSSTSCTELSSLGPESGHITVTIQGQDPMYIQSATEPMQQLAYATHIAEAPCSILPEVKQEANACAGVKLKKNRELKSGCSNKSAVVKNNSKCVSDLKRNRKWYRQKYSRHWDTAKEFSDWLTRAPNDPNTAYCLACCKRLKGGIAHLRRHSETPYHRRRMLDTHKERQLHMAQTAELNLTRFAHCHNLSMEAVCALPALLPTLFPDSDLCKLLSQDRMRSMMLVRKENTSLPSGDDSLSGSKSFTVKRSADVISREGETFLHAPHDVELNHHFKPSTEQHTYHHQQQSQHEQHNHDQQQQLEADQHHSSESHHYELKGSDQYQQQQHMGQPQQPCLETAMPHQLPTIHSHASTITSQQSTELTSTNTHYIPEQQQQEYITSQHSHQSHDHHQQQISYQSNHQTNLSHSNMEQSSTRNQQHQHRPTKIATSSEGLVQHTGDCGPTCQVVVSRHEANAAPHSAVPSPSQFETLPASSSSSVIVHQADTSNSEPVHSYTLSSYNCLTVLQVCGERVQRWHGRVAIVTGASAGVGTAICRSLVRLGMNVVGVARTHHTVKALSEELSGESGALMAVQCDVSKDDEVRDVFRQVTEMFGAVHLCINNADISSSSSLLEGDPEDWRRMLDVNVVALCLVTKLAVSSMKERGVDDGHVIHVNSIAGHGHPSRSPATHFHAATKQAVRSLTEGLRQELRAAHSHIRVSSLSLGPVASEFDERTPGDPAAAAKLSSTLDVLKADDVAASVVHILTAPAHVQINDIFMQPTEQS